MMGRYFTPAQSAEIWKRWKKGEGLKSISRALGRGGHSSIFAHMRHTGGIKPPPRHRSARALSLAEREEISRGIVAVRSVRSIARDLARSPSTVSREICRNGGSRRYRAEAADKRALTQALRPKLCKLAIYGHLQQTVARKLERNWSPEQIAGWLKRTQPWTEATQVSHETIYRSLYVQARGVLKKQLIQHLRSPRPMRRSRHLTQKRGTITDAVSIRERPACVDDRAVPGHWEGDLLCGSNNSNIVTLVERSSRYVMLAKLSNRETNTVIKALIKQAHKLPEELYRSLTWDRGSELADHKRFTMETDIAVYFCDPQSPWQRGSNENTNRLLRQYLPKGCPPSLFGTRKRGPSTQGWSSKARILWMRNSAAAAACLPPPAGATPSGFGTQQLGGKSRGCRT